MAKKGLILDIGVRISDTKEVTSQLEKSLQDLSKSIPDGLLTQPLKEEVAQLQEQLDSLKGELQEKYNELLQSKIDTSTFEDFLDKFGSFQKSVQNRLSELKGSIGQVAEQLSQFKTVMSLTDSTGATAALQKIIAEFNNLKQSIFGTNTILEEFVKLAGKKGLGLSIDSGESINKLKSYESKLLDIVSILRGQGEEGVLTFNPDQKSSVIQKITSMIDEYLDLQGRLYELQDTKNDTPADFTANMQKELDAVTQQMLEKMGKIRTYVDSYRFSFDELFDFSSTGFGQGYVSELKTATDMASQELNRINEMITEAQAKKQALVEVYDFKLKDGSIMIPLKVSTTESQIRKDVQAIINAVNDDIQNKPVTVPIKLVSGIKYLEKDETKEQIDKIKQGLPSELHQNLDTLIKDFSDQGDISIKVRSNIEDTKNSINNAIKEIQKMLNEQENRIVINPIIELKEEDKNQLSEDLKEFAQGFSFNIGEDAKTISDAFINNMNPDGVKEWGNNYIQALDSIIERLKQIKPKDIEKIKGLNENKNDKPKNAPKEQKPESDKGKEQKPEPDKGKKEQKPESQQTSGVDNPVKKAETELHQLMKSFSKDIQEMLSKLQDGINNGLNIETISKWESSFLSSIETICQKIKTLQSDISALFSGNNKSSKANPLDTYVYSGYKDALDGIGILDKEKRASIINKTNTELNKTLKQYVSSVYGDSFGKDIISQVPFMSSNGLQQMLQRYVQQIAIGKLNFSQQDASSFLDQDLRKIYKQSLPNNILEVLRDNISKYFVDSFKSEDILTMIKNSLFGTLNNNGYAEQTKSFLDKLETGDNKGLKIDINTDGLLDRIKNFLSASAINVNVEPNVDGFVNHIQDIVKDQKIIVDIEPHVQDFIDKIRQGLFGDNQDTPHEFQSVGSLLETMGISDNASQDIISDYNNTIRQTMQEYSKQIFESISIGDIFSSEISDNASFKQLPENVQKKISSAKSYVARYLQSYLSSLAIDGDEFDQQKLQQHIQEKFTASLKKQFEKTGIDTGNFSKQIDSIINNYSSTMSNSISSIFNKEIFTGLQQNDINAVFSKHGYGDQLNELLNPANNHIDIPVNIIMNPTLEQLYQQIHDVFSTYEIPIKIVPVINDAQSTIEASLPNIKKIKSVQQALQKLQDSFLQETESLNNMIQTNDKSLENMVNSFDTFKNSISTFLNDIQSSFNGVDISQSSFFQSLNEILDKGDELSTFAEILRSTKEEIKLASKNFQQNQKPQPMHFDNAEDVLKYAMSAYGDQGVDFDSVSSISRGRRKENPLNNSGNMLNSYIIRDTKGNSITIGDDGGLVASKTQMANVKPAMDKINSLLLQYEKLVQQFQNVGTMGKDTTGIFNEILQLRDKIKEAYSKVLDFADRGIVSADDLASITKRRNNLSKQSNALNKQFTQNAEAKNTESEIANIVQQIQAAIMQDNEQEQADLQQKLEDIYVRLTDKDASVTYGAQNIQQLVQAWNDADNAVKQYIIDKRNALAEQEATESLDILQKLYDTRTEVNNLTTQSMKGFDVSKSLEDATARLEELEKQAQDAYTSLKVLFDGGYISKEQFDNATKWFTQNGTFASWYKQANAEANEIDSAKKNLAEYQKLREKLYSIKERKANGKSLSREQQLDQDIFEQRIKDLEKFFNETTNIDDKISSRFTKIKNFYDSQERNFGGISFSNINENDFSSAEKAYQTLINNAVNYEKIQARINAGQKVTSEQYNWLKEISKYYDQAAKSEGVFADKSSEPAQKFMESMKQAQSFVQDMQINDLQQKFENLSNSQNGKPQAYLDMLETIKSKIEQINQMKIDPEVNHDDINQAIEETYKLIGTMNDDSMKPVTQKQKDALTARTRAWMNENSAAMKDFGSQLNDLLEQINAVDSKGGLDGIATKINNIKIQADKAGKTGASFATMLQARFKSLGAYLMSFASFYRIVDIFRNAINTIKDLDTALVEMNKVSQESLSTLIQYQKESFDIADAVGTSAKQIQQSTADWLRLGEAFSEAKQSAVTSNVLLNISEFENIDDATTALTSISQAYKELDKMQIVDKLNNIGNNFSISTDQIATGLQNAAAALQTQGNDIDETIALLTAGNAITQDISKTSAGVRTIALRISGTKEAKEQISEMGEDVEDFVVRTESKTDQIIRNYTAVASNAYKGVSVLDANGNLRDTYDILLDIAKIYKEIQEEDKRVGTNRAQALIETLAGKNRSNIAASILQNAEMLQSVYEASQQSAGSAQEELDKYLNSIEAKFTKFQNRLQELAFLAIDSDWIKNIVDLGSNAIKIISTLIDKFGSLQLVIGSVAGILLDKSGTFKVLNMFSNGVFNPKNAFNFKPIIDGMKKAFIPLPAELMSFVTTNFDMSGLFVNQTNAKKDAYSQMLGLNASFKSYVENLDEAEKSTMTFQDVLDGFRVKTFSAKDAFLGFGKTLKSVISSSLTVIAVQAVTILIGKAIEKISDWIHREEIAIKKAEEAQSRINNITSEQNEQLKETNELLEKYDKLRSGVKYTNTGLENISLSSDEFSEFLDINNKIGEMYPQLITDTSSYGGVLTDLGNDIANAREEINKYYDELARGNALDIQKELPTLLTATQFKSSGVASQAQQSQQFISDYEEILDWITGGSASGSRISDFDNNYATELAWIYDTIIQNLSTDEQDRIKLDFYDQNSEYTLDINTDGLNEQDAKDFIDNIKKQAYDALSELYGSDLTTAYNQESNVILPDLQRQLSSEWLNGFINPLIASLPAIYDYNEMSPMIQSLVQDQIRNFEYENSVFADEDTAKDPKKLQKAIMDAFIAPYTNVLKDGVELPDDFETQLKELHDKTADEFNAQINEWDQNLFNGDNEEAVHQFKVKYGLEFEFVDGLYESMADAAIEQVYKLLGGNVIRILNGNPVFIGEDESPVTSAELSELSITNLEKIIQAYSDGFKGFNGKGANELLNAIAEFYKINGQDTLKDLLKTDGLDDAKKTFESEMSSITDAIGKLKNGELTDADRKELSWLFPDIADTPLPELQDALEKLAGTKLTGFLNELQRQRKNLQLTDEEMEKYLALIRQILLANGADVNISGKDILGRLNTIYKDDENITEKKRDFQQTFADELQTEKGREILYTLSLEDDAASWTLDQWVEKYHEMEMQVDIVIRNDELTDYIKTQEKKIQDNANDISYNDAVIANKEANKDYNTSYEYGRNTALAERTLKIRQAIEDAWLDEVENARIDFSKGKITQEEFDNIIRSYVTARNDTVDAQSDVIKKQEEEVRGGAKATDDEIADKERQLSEIQQKISESGKEATVEQLEQQIKLQEEIGNLNTDNANYYAQFGDKYAEDTAKYREAASNARESTRNLQTEIASYGKYVVEDLDAQNASYSAQIAKLKTAIEGKKTTQGEWSVTEDDYAEILNLQDLISKNLSEKVAQTKEIYEKNLASRIDEEREKGNRVTAKELLKSDNDLMQLRTNWLNAQNELSEHQNEMTATQIESAMTGITRLNHEFDQLQTEADAKQSEIDRYVGIVGEQAEYQYDIMADYYKRMAEKQREIADTYRNSFFGFGEIRYADEIAQAEQNAIKYTNQYNDIVNGKSQRQRDRQTARLENRRNNNKVEIGRIEAENAVIEAKGGLLSPENYDSILRLQNDSLTALEQEISSTKEQLASPFGPMSATGVKKNIAKGQLNDRLNELLTQYAQEEQENINTQIAKLESTASDEQRAVTEAQRTADDLQHDIDNKIANHIDISDEEYVELSQAQSILSDAQETLANVYLGIAEDNADNYAIWSHFQDLGTQAQQASDTASTTSKQTSAAYSADELERLDRQLQILQDYETEINNIISDKQVKGLKVQEKDYRTLIALSKAQKVNLQAQNKELQAQYNITKDKALLDQIRQNNLSAMGLDSAILGYENTLKTLLVDQAKDLASAISSALSEVVTETGLTNETIDSLVTSFSDLGDRAEITGKLLYGSADGMKVDVRALQQMAEAERNLVNSQFTAKIKEQKDAIQQLMDSGDTSGLKKAQDELQYLLTQQTEYFALYQQQMNAFNEHGMIDIADQTANAGDNYDKAKQYLKDAKEMWDKGLVGTDNFKARAAYFDDFGLTDAETFKKNYDKINKYFTEDISGIRKYISDMQKNGLLVQKTLSDGSTALVGNFKDVSEAAKKMGISEQMFLDMAGKMHDYGGNIAFVTSLQDAALQASDLSQQLTNAQLEYADLIAQGASEEVLKKKQEEIDLIKASIEGLDSATQAYIDGTVEDYIESFDTLQARVQALAEARKEAMERGDVDAQQAFEDEIERLAKRYHIEISFDGEFDEESLEDAKQQAMEALGHGSIENPLEFSSFPETEVEVPITLAKSSREQFAESVIQAIGEGNLQQLIHLGLDQSDISSAAQYLEQIQEIGVTYEELSKVQLSNGTYELTGNMAKAEDALEGLAKALGFSKDEASLLIDALKSMGLIDFSEVIPTETQNKQLAYAESVFESIKQGNYQQLLHLGLDRSDISSVAKYVGEIEKLDISYEELSNVKFGNGAYELTGDMTKAEDALEGIAKVLGFSKDEANLLVDALKSMGLIKYSQISPDAEDIERFEYAQNVIQAIKQEDTESIENLGLSESQVTSVGEYVDQINELGISYEELSKVQLGNGAYELTGDMTKAEDALEGIAKTLGFSGDEAQLLVKALASLGLIDYSESTPEEMAEYLENIDDTIEEINKNSEIELGFTIEAGGSSLEYLNMLTNEELDSQVKKIRAKLELTVDEQEREVLQHELESREYILNIREYVSGQEDTKAAIAYLQHLLTSDPEKFQVETGITLSDDTATAEQQISTISDMLTSIQENNSVTVKLDAEQFEALTAADETTTIAIDGDNSEAMTAVKDVVDAAETADPVITIKGDNRNAKQAVDEAVNYANRQYVKLTVNADLSRAVQDINQLIRDIEDVKPEMKIIADTQHFIQTFQEFLSSQQFTADIVGHLTGTVNHISGGGGGGNGQGTTFYTGSMNRIAKSGSAYNMINLTPAHADGTNGVALSHDETSLVSELGQESIVRDGKWYLLPAGAHFEHLKKGDIVFNHIFVMWSCLAISMNKFI